MDLSIIIPCYNEEKRIAKTLDRINSYLSKQSYTYEIIVVDNGSTDSSGMIVQAFMSKMKNLTFISERSHGKGWAIKRGMLAAKGEYRLFTDADNSTDISQLEKLMAEAKKGYDVVISSRKAPGAVIKNPQPFYRRLTSISFSSLVAAIVPLDIKDTQNGFKLFTKEAAEKIFPHQTIYYWAFDVEILAIAKIWFKVKEVPITWINDDQSTMRFSGMIRMLYEVIVTRINLSTSQYIKNERRQKSISEVLTERRVANIRRV